MLTVLADLPQRGECITKICGFPTGSYEPKNLWRRQADEGNRSPFPTHLKLFRVVQRIDPTLEAGNNRWQAQPSLVDRVLQSAVPRPVRG
jgi:hypothetical protein